MRQHFAPLILPVAAAAPDAPEVERVANGSRLVGGPPWDPIDARLSFRDLTELLRRRQPSSLHASD